MRATDDRPQARPLPPLADRAPAMTQPACMTDTEYEMWSANGYRTSPCLDCPWTFAKEMRALDCCDGVPGGRGGRQRLTERLVSYRGRGSKYPTDMDRIDARRQQWRDADARKKARKAARA